MNFEIERASLDDIPHIQKLTKKLFKYEIVNIITKTKIAINEVIITPIIGIGSSDPIVKNPIIKAAIKVKKAPISP